MNVFKTLLLLVVAASMGGCVVVDDGAPYPGPHRFGSCHYGCAYHFHDTHFDNHHERPRPRPMFDGRPSDFPGVKQPSRPRGVVSGRGKPPTVR